MDNPDPLLPKKTLHTCLLRLIIFLQCILLRVLNLSRVINPSQWGMPHHDFSRNGRRTARLIIAVWHSLWGLLCAILVQDITWSYQVTELWRPKRSNLWPILSEIVFGSLTHCHWIDLGMRDLRQKSWERIWCSFSHTPLHHVSWSFPMSIRTTGPLCDQAIFLVRVVPSFWDAQLFDQVNPWLTGGEVIFAPPPRFSAISPEVTYRSSPNFPYPPNHQFDTSWQKENLLGLIRRP